MFYTLISIRTSNILTNIAKYRDLLHIELYRDSLCITLELFFSKIQHFKTHGIKTIISKYQKNQQTDFLVMIIELLCFLH